MSHYDGREPHREYDYWTDEKVRIYLESVGGVANFFLFDGDGYGQFGPDGESCFVMDDDDDRVNAIVAFLRKIGDPKQL